MIIKIGAVSVISLAFNDRPPVHIHQADVNKINITKVGKKEIIIFSSFVFVPFLNILKNGKNPKSKILG